MKKAIFAVVVLAFLSGCGKKSSTGLKKDEKAIAVTVSNVQFLKNSRNLNYSGTIEAWQTIPLTFQTIGIVEQVFVDAGDRVRKGQILATVEKTDLQNICNASLAKYRQAQDAYNRLKSVHEQGSLPEIKWIEMETNLEQAKSSYELSKNNMEKCNMRAPIDGIIGKRNVEPGQSALSINSAPIELVKIEKVYVKISIPENEIGLLKTGIKARFTVSALNNKNFEGEITNISPVADAISRTYTGKVLVNNSNIELKPGMVCDVIINLNTERNVLAIPHQSVSKDKDGNTYVFVVNPNTRKVTKQTIQVGEYQSNMLVVNSGLTLGQTVVVDGKEKLADNSIIRL